MLVPAGYVTTVYDPVFRSLGGLHALCLNSFVHANQDPQPGLPFSLVFRAEPGSEDVLLQIASTYEAASKRRVPPPAFGPLPTSIEWNGRADGASSSFARAVIEQDLLAMSFDPEHEERERHRHHAKSQE